MQELIRESGYLMDFSGAFRGPVRKILFALMVIIGILLA